MSVDRGTFRDAMAQLSAHVTIVAAYAADGRPVGFTASAVCSLSLDPPLVLVCIDRRSGSHGALLAAERFSVNVLADEHEDLALRFATRGVDRFAGREFDTGPGAPHLPGALTALVCRRHAIYPGGDHTILVGRVEQATTCRGEPLLYFDRGFCRLNLARAL